MSALIRTQMPNCKHRSERNFEVVKRQGEGKPHHFLQCYCGVTAKNAVKPKRLIRYDSELLRQRQEELRRRRAGDKTLRK